MILKMVTIHMDKKNDNKHHQHQVQFGSIFCEEELWFLMKILIYDCCPNFLQSYQTFQGFWHIRINRHFGSGLLILNFQAVSSLKVG